MSIHPSLRGADTLTGDRSVFTRIERVNKLMKEGKLKDEDSAFGLPKIRAIFKAVKKPKAEPAAADAAAIAAATPAPAEAAPAPEAAKPARKGGKG